MTNKGLPSDITRCHAVYDKEVLEDKVVLLSIREECRSCQRWLYLSTGIVFMSPEYDNWRTKDEEGKLEPCNMRIPKVSPITRFY